MSSNYAGGRTSSLRRLGHNASHASKNHILGVIAGSIARPSLNFRHPELIIAGLVYALTRSNMLVALTLMITKSSIFLPQLLLSSFLEHHNRRRPFYIGVTIARGFFMAVLAAAVWLMALGVTNTRLFIFFTAYMLMSLASGMTQVIFNDMTGRLIFPHRIGSFLGMRLFLGGALGAIAGIVVIQPILAGFSVPVNYAILLSISTLLLVISMGIWCFCAEEPGASAKKPTTFKDTIGRGIKWLKEDPSYRNFLWQRMGFRVSYLALVFFIPYGTEQLSQKSGAGIALLGGLMVAIYQVSDVIASAIWGKVVDKMGSRVTLAGAAIFMFLAPLLALIAPLVPDSFELYVPHLPISLNLPLIIYLLGLAVLGIGNRGNMLGGNRFLITAAPAHRRPSYFAFINTLACPLTLLPLLGAWISSIAGMPAVFIFAALGSFVCLLAALRMAPDNQ